MPIAASRMAAPAKLMKTGMVERKIGDRPGFVPALILRPRPAARRPLQILTSPYLPQELPILYDQFAARHHLAHVPFHAEALEHRVVHTHVVRFCADGVIGLRIP